MMNGSRLVWTASALFLVLLLAPAAPADEVVLTNGDRLTGEVVRVTERDLVFRSELAGEVTIPRQNIRTFSTEQPVEIHLRDGTIIHRQVRQDEPGHVITEDDPLLPATRISLDDLLHINPPPPQRPRWTGDTTIGLTVARGNSESESVNVGVNLQRRAERDRITLGGAYYYGRQRDPDTRERRTSQNNWSLTAKYDYFFSRRFYGYANIRIERDRIADLDLRLAPGVGVGYQWIETSRTHFLTEGGLTWMYERYENATAETRRTLSGRLAYSFSRQFTDRIRFFHSTEYFPSLEDIDDYLLKSEVGLRASLTDRMFTEAKVVLDYDAIPAPGARRTDVRYLLSAGWQF